jgi:hypothetical protein
MIVAAAGTPVHAIAAGVVRLPAGGDGTLRLRTDDGLDIGYAGLGPRSRTVDDGHHVPAGAVLAVVGAVADPTVPAYLQVDVRDRAGAQLDAAELLLGLPDPNELGYPAAGAALGVDPDGLDRMLAASPSVPDGRFVPGDPDVQDGPSVPSVPSGRADPDAGAELVAP